MSVDLTLRLRVGGDHATEGSMKFTCEILVEPQSRDHADIGASTCSTIDRGPVGSAKRQDERIIDHVGIPDAFDNTNVRARNFARESWGRWLDRCNTPSTHAGLLGI